MLELYKLIERLCFQKSYFYTTGSFLSPSKGEIFKVMKLTGSSFLQQIQQTMTLKIRVMHAGFKSSPRAVAISPSCHARQWKAVGAIPTGKLISVPCTVVRVSLTETSRRIRGLRRILSEEHGRTTRLHRDGFKLLLKSPNPLECVSHQMTQTEHSDLPGNRMQPN